MNDINHWKVNAENNYINTPISVLRYITELEKLIKPRLTDEQIDAMFPETGEASVDYYLPLQIDAARQVRDLLQGKGGEGV